MRLPRTNSTCLSGTDVRHAATVGLLSRCCVDGSAAHHRERFARDRFRAPDFVAAFAFVRTFDFGLAVRAPLGAALRAALLFAFDGALAVAPFLAAILAPVFATAFEAVFAAFFAVFATVFAIFATFFAILLTFFAVFVAARRAVVACGVTWCTANPAPCGSPRIAIEPPGMSICGRWIVAPALIAVATALATSST